MDTNAEYIFVRSLINYKQEEGRINLQMARTCKQF